jgi:hypothetical protein
MNNFVEHDGKTNSRTAKAVAICEWARMPGKWRLSS